MNLWYLTNGLLSWREEHIAKPDIIFLLLACFVSGGITRVDHGPYVYSPDICHQQTIVLSHIIGGIQHFFVIWTSLFLDSFVRKCFNIILDALTSACKILQLGKSKHILDISYLYL